jgi:hypothetical protein
VKGGAATLLAALLLAAAAAPHVAAATAEPPARRSGFVIAPVAYYTPETRLAWGVVGIHYFRLGAVAGPSRLSHYRFNLIRTQNHQTVAQLDYEVYLPGGRFLVDGVAKYSYYPDRFYGLGNRTPEAGRENFTSGNWRLQLDLQRRFGESLFAGLRFETQTVAMFEREEGGALATGEVTGGAGGALAGLGLFAKWDSRDNTFSATRGSYAALFLSRYLPLLGADFSYGLLLADARRYWPLGKGIVLAAQGIFKAAWGQPPFQALPMFGGLNLLRGYYDGRYRDRCLLVLQGECRLPLAGRFGLCGFIGAAQVQPQVTRFELDGFHLAGGAGLRFFFNRRENLIVRLDAGFAGAAPAFYLTFAEAF